MCKRVGRLILQWLILWWVGVMGCRARTALQLVNLETKEMLSTSQKWRKLYFGIAFLMDLTTLLVRMLIALQGPTKASPSSGLQ